MILDFFCKIQIYCIIHSKQQDITSNKIQILLSAVTLLRYMQKRQMLAILGAVGKRVKLHIQKANKRKKIASCAHYTVGCTTKYEK
jgi:hypothetical protein